MDDLTTTSGAQRYAAGLLTGELVQLRALAEEDLPQLDAWWQRIEDAALQGTVVMPRPAGSSTENTRAWSGNTGRTADVGFSVVERSSGELAGHLTLFGATWWDRSAEAAIILGPDHQGRGLGPDALRVLLGYAFDELGLHRVSLKVWAFNDRAVAAYRRAGFVEEGRLREVAFHASRWHDHVLMAVLEHEWRARAGDTAAAGDEADGPTSA